MANFNIVGFDDVEKMFLHESEAATKAVPEMLKAGADVLVKAQKDQIRAMGIVDTGALEKSIKATKVTQNAANSAIIVRPTGKDKKGIRNAEKGFIAEYGKRGQAAKPWQETANTVSENAVHEAMQKVWEGYK